MRRPSVLSIVQSGLVAALYVVLIWNLVVPGRDARALAAGTAAAAGTPTTGGTPTVTRPGPPASSGNPSTVPAATPAVATAATPQGAAPASTASPSAATVSGTPTRPIATPTSGALSASLSGGFSPLAFTITGRPQVAQSTLVVEVRDTARLARQPGWYLTLSIGQFHVTGAPSRALPRDAVSLVGVTVRCVGAVPCGDPENSIEYPLPLPAGETVTIFDAAPGSGSGAFLITLVLEVQVSGDAYAGGYDAAMAVGIARGR